MKKRPFLASKAKGLTIGKLQSAMKAMEEAEKAWPRFTGLVFDQSGPYLRMRCGYVHEDGTVEYREPERFTAHLLMPPAPNQL